MHASCCLLAVPSLSEGSFVPYEGITRADPVIAHKKAAFE